MEYKFYIYSIFYINSIDDGMAKRIRWNTHARTHNGTESFVYCKCIIMIGAWYGEEKNAKMKLNE